MKKLLSLLCIIFAFGCVKVTEEGADIQESAQQIGDVMASVDEVGGSSGNIASNQKQLENSIAKTFERYAPNELDNSYKAMISQLLQPFANAATCSGAGFDISGCAGSRTMTRNFSSCTVGAATFSGSVTATWAGAGTGCALGGATDTITRVPNFTVTGRRGATLTVSKSGTIGQRITWASGAGTTKVFSFTNDGINRTFRDSTTAVLFNQTTTITSPITVTGNDRANRVLSGGVLRVSNNVTSVNCDYAPTAVTWTPSCNCPTSGSWNGTCSNGKTSTLQITGCGTGTYSEGSDTQSVSFDRCGT